MRRRFDQFDVFSAVALKGNPLAVVHAAQGLSDATMADLARWINLSETAFLLPATDPGADYRMRVFTPGGELPFAGHPTLGSAHAWLAAGGCPRDAQEVVQECGIGQVRIRRDGSRLAFAAPPLRRSGPLAPALVKQLARALGLGGADVLHHQWVDNGPGWCALMLRDAAQVLALRPDMTLLGEARLGVLGRHRLGDEALFEVRAFIPALGVPEDPVTGSLHAGLAQWLMGAGLAPRAYLATQGEALGRAGRVHLQQDGERVWVGGDIAACISGTIEL